MARLWRTRWICRFAGEMINRRRWRIAPIALFVSLAGCATFGPSAHKEQKPEPGTVAQIMAIWQPTVCITLDPIHNGASEPCLAGRLYLFGPDDKARTAEGTVLVSLYNDDVHSPDGQPYLASYWQLDSDKLNKAAFRKDMVGWGYTLILPLAKYDPNANHVHLTVQYQPKKGIPVFTASGPMVLQPPDTPMPVVRQTTFTPGATPVKQSAAAAPAVTQPQQAAVSAVPAVPQQQSPIQQTAYKPAPAAQSAPQMVWPWASPPPPGALPGMVQPPGPQPVSAPAPPMQAPPVSSNDPWQYRPAGALPASSPL
jgi:hypothetical protein